MQGRGTTARRSILLGTLISLEVLTGCASNGGRIPPDSGSADAGQPGGPAPQTDGGSSSDGGSSGCPFSPAEESAVETIMTSAMADAVNLLASLQPPASACPPTLGVGYRIPFTPLNFNAVLDCGPTGCPSGCVTQGSFCFYYSSASCDDDDPGQWEQVSAAPSSITTPFSVPVAGGMVTVTVATTGTAGGASDYSVPAEDLASITQETVIALTPPGFGSISIDIQTQGTLSLAPDQPSWQLLGTIDGLGAGTLFVSASTPSGLGTGLGPVSGTASTVMDGPPVATISPGGITWVGACGTGEPDAGVGEAPDAGADGGDVLTDGG